MSTLTALARIEAARTGSAQPVATVRHCHLGEQPLVLIPLKLSGEAAAPLAAMVGTARKDPALLVVAQPRNRDLRFGFAAELAALVLSYVESRQAGTETVPTKDGEGRQRYSDAPQVLVPNPGGITFLRLLGRSTRFRRIDGPYPVEASVPLLGRWLTWLCDRAEQPGSSVLMPMTSMLAGHWATGQSTFEDANLGALLGWLDPPEGMTGPQAALRAEDPLVCPPAGPTTDPGFDNEELAPLLAAYDRAPADQARMAATERLRRALRRQLEPTWELMWRSVELLRALPEGAHVTGRWEGDRESFTHFAEGIPEGFPQAKRDSAVAAARRLIRLERAQDELDVQRALDDPLVMAEHRLTGEAFAGIVVAAQPDRLDTTGKTPKLRPYLQVRTSDPLRVADGDTVHNAGRKGQKAQVVDVNAGTVLLELSSGMGRKRVAEPGSVPEVGDRVCFTTFAADFHRSPVLPPLEQTPWTHGGPPEAYVPGDDEAVAYPPTAADALEVWE
ncbi:MAG TPA: hypothetical protein VNW94_23395 [Streptosporangiaceae bacterium]|nr:hypothetical protein [Streptosporangiaceae bacterium]